MMETLFPLPRLVYEPIVRIALGEDLGLAGDVTSALSLPPEARIDAAIIARQAGRIAGIGPAALAAELVDPAIRFNPVVNDGAAVLAGAEIARVSGPARAVLSAERVMLNFIGQLSGTATLTARFVAAIEGTGARILCTRKTAPGMRALQKHAVRAGGGFNHRMNLADAVLIKDNHAAAAGGVVPALRRAKEQLAHLVAIEVEVDSLTQWAEILALPRELWPHAVMLDNFSVADLRAAVAQRTGTPGAQMIALEASGGVRLETVRQIAETGVDYISVGALTHSAPALDIGLDARPLGG